MSDLRPEKALIFRITHIANVPWILDHGLHCRNSETYDTNYIDIGNPDLIAKRTARAVDVEPGGTLSDYIPFYFTPYSPMLYNIKTGYGGMKKTPMSQIAILVSSLHTIAQRRSQFVFTDRHAYLQTAEYFNDLADLKAIDWQLLQSRDFKRNPNDPGKFERYQAEALVYRSLAVDALAGIACRDAQAEALLSREVEKRRLPLKVLARPGWFF